MNINIEQEFKNVCAEWRAAGATKIHITDLESVYGLCIESDKLTGRVIGATLDNEPITLAKALRLRFTLSNACLWIDTGAGEFKHSGIDPVMANCLIDAVKKNITGACHG